MSDEEVMKQIVVCNSLSNEQIGECNEKFMDLIEVVERHGEEILGSPYSYDISEVNI